MVAHWSRRQALGAGLLAPAAVGLLPTTGAAQDGPVKFGEPEPFSFERLVVQAKVANRDVGRLHPGMPATVKVRAFDYLRYGSLDGVLQKVAADAAPDPRSGELAYAVTVLTDRGHLGQRTGELEVVPGMLVDVDLKIGERTILSFLTDRIFRFQEAFREG